MMLEKFQEWFFGGDSSSEDDHLRPLIQCIAIILNNKVQNTIFKLHFLGMVIHNIISVVYIFFWTPETDELIKMLPGLVLSSQFQSSFIFIVSLKDYIGLSMNQTKAFEVYIRKSGKKLRKRLENDAIKMKHLRNAALVIVITNLILMSPHFCGDEHNLVVLPLFKNVVGDYVIIEIIYFVFGSYCACLGILTFFISLYGCYHLKDQLMILNKNWEKYNSIAYKHMGVDNQSYQKAVREELKRSWKHFLQIKRFKSSINEMSYWPMLTSSLHCTLVMGTTAVNLLQVQNESERLPILLQSSQWHQWDRDNRKFLQMFMLSSEEPMTISLSGIVDQNRILSLKIYKGLYSIVTFYNTTTH
ncbi:hypothetical protein JTB14_030480 [Gonioctena quinquepunctata]|nr:hypothetical protein JTB14_030480 [Gonioctena quinquepunctata]